MTGLPSNKLKNVITYLFLTFTFSSVFYFLIISNGHLGGGHGLFVLGLMWCPAVAALITCRISGIPIKEMGWKLKPAKYIAYSYLLPIAYAFVTYLIIWITKGGGFYNKEFVEVISMRSGFPGIPAGMAIAYYALITGTTGMIGSMLSALGEEIGWRGFLVPQLAKNYSFAKTSIIVGIIWSLWHYPILLFADYNNGAPAWFSLTCFTVMVIAISFAFAWFRLKSGSLLTGVVLHASHNLFIQSIFTPLTFDTGNTKYFIDEFGIGLPIACVIIAVILWSKRKYLPGSIETENLM
jgi:membrane protease YdiL (CAAX protease family)